MSVCKYPATSQRLLQCVNGCTVKR